jgi:hypothetical protein
MPEESTTPDLVERVRGLVGAVDRCDVDTFVSFQAPDAVLEAAVGRFEGVAAITGFIEDWLANYEEFAATLEEVRDLGNGVTFSVIRQQGRPVGSSGHVQLCGLSGPPRRRAIEPRSSGPSTRRQGDAPHLRL